MGEIIFSVVVGCCLVLSGIILIVSSKKESKRELKRLADKQSNASSDELPDAIDAKEGV